MKVYIDDIRTPRNKYDKVLRNSEESIEYFTRYGCPEFISFDHDLGGDDTAMRIVKFLIEMDLDMQGEFIPIDFTFNVHSANPVGKKNIEGYLGCYLRRKLL